MRVERVNYIFLKYISGFLEGGREGGIKNF